MISMLNQESIHLSIFEGLDPAAMRLIDPMLEVCSFHQDESIFEQGQTATYLYILLQGEVIIRFKPYDGPALTVAHIEQGGVFGWSSALGRDSYTSGAVAVQDSRATRLRGDQLHKLCEQRPEIGVVVLERLASVIAERLQSTHAQILSILTEGMELNNEWRKRLAKND